MSDVFRSVNPATGKEIATYEIYDEKKVELAINQSRKTFEEWRQLPCCIKKYCQRNSQGKRQIGKVGRY